MSNKRPEIRSALKLILEAAEYENVFTSRRAGVSQKEQLPAITIFTPNEPATPRSLNQKDYIRKLQLRIEIRISASNDVDDELDAIAADIEEIMITNSSLSGTVSGSVLVDSETEVGMLGNTPIGLCTLVYECTYVA